MTREEAIEILIDQKDNDVFVSEWRDKIHEALKMSIEALQKQIPQKMIYISDGYADGYLVWDMARCPGCDMCFDDGDDDWKVAKFCPRCGQAIDWEMEASENK